MKVSIGMSLAAALYPCRMRMRCSDNRLNFAGKTIVVFVQVVETFCQEPLFPV